MDLQIATLLLLFSFSLLCNGQNYSFASVPAYTSQDTIITAQYGDTVTIYCAVYDNTSQVDTTWKVESDGSYSEVTFGSLNGIGTGTYTYLTTTPLDTHTNLSVTFSTGIDPLKLACTIGSEIQAVFFIGKPTSPMLQDLSSNVTEGDSYTFNLTALGNAPFPPDAERGKWTFNDEMITDSNIMYTNYTITFNSVNRNQTGVYRLIVSNDAGSSNATLIINVQYKPGGTPGNTKLYVRLGYNITLMAFTNFDSGNPDPLAETWFNDNGAMINESSSLSRYIPNFTGTTRTLTIINFTNEDDGNWTFGARNAIGDAFINIMLIIVVPPGPPLNLQVTSNDGYFVVLGWDNPTNIGTPNLTHYIIQLTPPPPRPFMNNISYEVFYNTLLLDNLVPNTLYTATVFGVSGMFPTLFGESSMVNFTTPPGPPSIGNTSLSENDGHIRITWSFIHIGGVDKDDLGILVSCAPLSAIANNDSSDVSSGGASGNGDREPMGQLTGTCTGDDDTCISDKYTGSLKLDETSQAGETYLCIMFAGIGDNQLLRDFKNLSYITPITGIPSPPYGVVNTAMRYSVNVGTHWSGVIQSDDSFMFRIYSIDGTINITSSQPNYSNNQMITIDLSTAASPGVYQLYAVAINKYGISTPTLVVGQLVIMTPTPTPTPSPTMMTPGPTGGTDNRRAIIGGVVGGLAGIVLLVAIIVAVLVIVLVMISKKKKGSMQVNPSPTKKEKEMSRFP